LKLLDIPGENNKPGNNFNFCRAKKSSNLKAKNKKSNELFAGLLFPCWQQLMGQLPKRR
jgi:hypothetical protein